MTHFLQMNTRFHKHFTQEDIGNIWASKHMIRSLKLLVIREMCVKTP